MRTVFFFRLHSRCRRLFFLHRTRTAAAISAAIGGIFTAHFHRTRAVFATAIGFVTARTVGFDSGGLRVFALQRAIVAFRAGHRRCFYRVAGLIKSVNRHGECHYENDTEYRQEFFLHYFISSEFNLKVVVLPINARLTLFCKFPLNSKNTISQIGAAAIADKRLMNFWRRESSADDKTFRRGDFNCFAYFCRRRLNFDFSGFIEYFCRKNTTIERLRFVSERFPRINLRRFRAVVFLYQRTTFYFRTCRLC